MMDYGTPVLAMFLALGISDPLLHACLLSYWCLPVLSYSRCGHTSRVRGHLRLPMFPDCSRKCQVTILDRDQLWDNV